MVDVTARTPPVLQEAAVRTSLNFDQSGVGTWGNKFAEPGGNLVNVKRVSPEHLKQFDQRVAAIEASTATPTMVSLSEFKTRRELKTKR